MNFFKFFPLLRCQGNHPNWQGNSIIARDLPLVQHVERPISAAMKSGRRGKTDLSGEALPVGNWRPKEMDEFPAGR
ncbi:MAG: hypothetical protein CME16_04775 [Gemmatimonadetes bacterium]|nr:hypothetical protein [Gemmatimonadota bacterium]